MRPAGRSRAGAGAVALAVLLAQAGGLAHGALATHVRCEHGELIEVEVSDEAAIAPPALEPREAGVAASATEGGAASDHQHCLAQLQARTPLVLRPQPLHLPAPPSARSRATSRRGFASGGDRYRLVPKQSPPA